MRLRGLFRLLFLYDVAESIDLGKLRSLLGERGGSADQAFPRRTPGYVRFEHPPVVEPADVIFLFVGASPDIAQQFEQFDEELHKLPRKSLRTCAFG